MTKSGVAFAGLALIATALAAIVALVSVGQESGFVGELPGRIAFTSNEDNDPGDIYVVEASGANRIRLTSTRAYDGHPSWSPDGSELAFWSTRDGNAGDIYTMQANGQGIMRLTRHLARDAFPAWSPDGTRIAFVSARDNNLGDIYVMNTDGTEPMRLTDGPLLETHPCWSCDGSEIAFISVRPGVSSRVYVVPAGGGIPDQLVTADGWASDPAWCPVRNELIFVLSKGSSNWGDIWFADALAGTILRQWRYKGRESGASWSRDGKMICCSHSERPSGRDANLVAFDTEGGDVYRITDTDAADVEPDWWTPEE